MSEAKKKSNYRPKTAFKKGNVPWNKGIKGTHFSPETEFKGKPVLRLDEKGNIAKEYDRVRDVEQDGYWATSVSRACKETWRTSGGSKWMYKEDYEKLLEDIASQELN